MQGALPVVLGASSELWQQEHLPLQPATSAAPVLRQRGSGLRAGMPCPNAAPPPLTWATESEVLSLGCLVPRARIFSGTSACGEEAGRNRAVVGAGAEAGAPRAGAPGLEAARRDRLACPGPWAHGHPQQPPGTGHARTQECATVSDSRGDSETPAEPLVLVTHWTRRLLLAPGAVDAPDLCLRAGVGQAFEVRPGGGAGQRGGYCPVPPKVKAQPLRLAGCLGPSRAPAWRTTAQARAQRVWE